MTDALTTQHTDLGPALLADRSLLNLERAVTYLAGRLRARTPMGASEYLELKTRHEPGEYDWRLNIAVQVCGIYRDLFARQYAASQAPPYSLRREQEFYCLVNRHLFPLGDVEDFIRREPSFFLPCITVKSMQTHDWRQGRFDCRKVETVYKLAQVLSQRSWTITGGYGWRDLAAAVGLEDFPQPAPPLHAVGWQLFKYSCSVSNSPLRWLPLAFEVTNYSTGSVFLDKPGGSFGFEWTRRNVGKLFLERTAAQEVLASVHACDEWLDSAPRLNVGAAVALWNTAAEVEAQSPHPDLLGEPGEFFYVPEMRELYARMEGR